MVIVAIMSSCIFSEIMYLGRVIGAIVIVLGLYLVLWGKSKDQLSSDSDTNKAAPSSGEPMATTSETAKTSGQDFILLDVSGVAPADESFLFSPSTMTDVKPICCANNIALTAA
ncbi:hypothetical protein CRYUN_Cryun41cG0021500 [Craigia yunnanensis]